jgi:hypothetical protein
VANDGDLVLRAERVDVGVRHLGDVGVLLVEVLLERHQVLLGPVDVTQVGAEAAATAATLAAAAAAVAAAAAAAAIATAAAAAVATAAATLVSASATTNNYRAARVTVVVITL